MAAATSVRSLGEIHAWCKEEQVQYAQGLKKEVTQIITEIFRSNPMRYNAPVLRIDFSEDNSADVVTKIDGKTMSVYVDFQEGVDNAFGATKKIDVALLIQKVSQLRTLIQELQI